MSQTLRKILVGPRRGCSVVGSVTCDRCGEDGHCRNASADAGGTTGGGGPWGVVRVMIQGRGPVEERHLCRTCSEVVINAVDNP